MDKLSIDVLIEIAQYLDFDSYVHFLKADLLISKLLNHPIILRPIFKIPITTDVVTFLKYKFKYLQFEKNIKKSRTRDQFLGKKCIDADFNSFKVLISDMILKHKNIDIEFICSIGFNSTNEIFKTVNCWIFHKNGFFSIRIFTHSRVLYHFRKPFDSKLKFKVYCDREKNKVIYKFGKKKYSVNCEFNNIIYPMYDLGIQFHNLIKKPTIMFRMI